MGLVWTSYDGVPVGTGNRDPDFEEERVNEGARSFYGESWTQRWVDWDGVKREQQHGGLGHPRVTTFYGVTVGTKPTAFRVHDIYYGQEGFWSNVALFNRGLPFRTRITIERMTRTSCGFYPACHAGGNELRWEDFTRPWVPDPAWTKPKRPDSPPNERYQDSIGSNFCNIPWNVRMDWKWDLAAGWWTLSNAGGYAVTLPKGVRVAGRVLAPHEWRWLAQNSDSLSLGVVQIREGSRPSGAKVELDAWENRADFQELVMGHIALYA